MDGDSPYYTAIEEYVPVIHTLDTDLHHVERVSPTGHHMAHTTSSALTTTTAPTSRPHSSCTTSLPRTTPPPEASSTGTQPPIAACDPHTEGQSYDELPLLEREGLAASFTATTDSGAATIADRVLTPRTGCTAGNQHFGTPFG